MRHQTLIFLSPEHPEYSWEVGTTEAISVMSSLLHGSVVVLVLGSRRYSNPVVLDFKQLPKYSK
jgi:hypothetical protein